MIGKCIVLVGMLSLAQSSCFDACLSNMGCTPGNCGDVWENCCRKYECSWNSHCTPKRFLKVKAAEKCDVQNGYYIEGGSVGCYAPNILNPVLGEENNFACVDGQVRWKYDIVTGSGTVIPGFPLCSSLDVAPNSGEEPSLPAWDVCDNMQCFDAEGNFNEEDNYCADLCSVFNKRGLHHETTACCEINSEGISVCATSTVNQQAKCEWKGCGSEWVCGRDMEGDGRGGQNHHKDEYYELLMLSGYYANCVAQSGDACTPDLARQLNEDIIEELNHCRLEHCPHPSVCYKCYKSLELAREMLKITSTDISTQTCERSCP